MISAGTNAAFGADIDGQTVLISETNSHLGHLLLEGDFEDCRFCVSLCFGAVGGSVLTPSFHTKAFLILKQAKGETMPGAITTL